MAVYLPLGEVGELGQAYVQQNNAVPEVNCYHKLVERAVCFFSKIGLASVAKSILKATVLGSYSFEALYLRASHTNNAASRIFSSMLREDPVRQQFLNGNLSETSIMQIMNNGLLPENEKIDLLFVAIHNRNVRLVGYLIQQYPNFLDSTRPIRCTKALPPGVKALQNRPYETRDFSPAGYANHLQANYQGNLDVYSRIVQILQRGQAEEGNVVNVGGNPNNDQLVDAQLEGQ